MSFQLRYAARVCLTLTFLFTPTVDTKAQDADLLDLVKECDLLAAHPSDPQRLAEGVSDDSIVPRLAIRACEEAVKEDAKDPRFSFQLGRALLAAGKKAESAATFRQAADAGYAAAWAYLGDAFQFGHGQPVNYEQAREAYAKARDGGFEPAKGLVDQMSFVPNMYAVAVVGQFYSKQSDAISNTSKDAERKWLTRSYVFSFVQKLMGECDEVVAPSSIVKLYTYRYGGGWTNDIDAQTAVGIYASIGEHDGNVFLKRHGCEGVIAKHLFQSVNAFLTGFSE